MYTKYGAMKPRWNQSLHLFKISINNFISFPISSQGNIKASSNVLNCSGVFGTAKAATGDKSVNIKGASKYRRIN